MSPFKRLTISIIVLLFVLVGGTAGYLAIESDADPSLLDASYMTVITLSGVGFKEMWDISPMGRVWTIGIITVGLGAASVSITSLFTIFVSGELVRARGRRRLEESINKLSNHVIICGYGRVGALTAAGLKERGKKVVVIEADKESEDDLRRAGVPYIVGDATEEDSLMEAGIERASSIVSVLPSDADNVFVTLTAHTINPSMRIVSRAEHPSTERKLKRAGASTVICPQIVGAVRITNVLTRPNVVDFMEMAHKGVDLELDEYIVQSDSRLCGLALSGSLVREKTGATVVAIKRDSGETLFNPSPDTPIQAMDTLIIVGPAGASEKFGSLETES